MELPDQRLTDLEQIMAALGNARLVAQDAVDGASEMIGEWSESSLPAESFFLGGRLDAMLSNYAALAVATEGLLQILNRAVFDQSLQQLIDEGSLDLILDGEGTPHFGVTDAGKERIQGDSE